MIKMKIDYKKKRSSTLLFGCDTFFVNIYSLKFGCGGFKQKGQGHSENR
jgi:hypothetical protein